MTTHAPQNDPSDRPALGGSADSHTHVGGGREPTDHIGATTVTHKAADAGPGAPTLTAPALSQGHPTGGTVPATVAIELTYGPLRRHAKGGLGDVLVAEEPLLSRQVAVKVLQERWADDPRACRDFLMEAEVTSRLEHPGIVPVHGLGCTTDGRPCYSMRFVQGETLRAAIRRFHEMPSADAAERSLAFRELLTRFIAVCNTVAYAHSRGVLHRDLKPENIMLGPFGETLVLDWGMAKAAKTAGAEATADILPQVAVADDATAVGEVRGTVPYLSPEQATARHDQIGPATDVFGLGATLYAILTGTAPYREATVESALDRAKLAVFVSPRKRHAAVPAALDAICCKAMARCPEERYRTAQDLAHDVENWLAGERVLGWREPWHVGLRRYLRRHRTVVAVLAALAVVIPAVGTVASWFVAREQARAELDRRTAEVNERAAAQITDYLVRIFESADPVGLDATGFRGPGERSEEQSARRMLDRGAVLVREHLHNQPLMRAGLLDAMGNANRNLGAWDEADKLLKEGYELRRRHLGDEDADTATSLQSLARLAHDRGEYGEADRRYREVIARREKLYGPDHLLVAETKAYLAWMTFHRPLSTEGPQFNQTTLGDAERLLLEVLAVRERQLPSDHRDIGYTLAALASIKMTQPHQELAALAYAARASEVFRHSDQDTLLGSAVVEILNAERQRKARQYVQAEAGYLKALALSRRHLGNRHPLVLIQMGNLAGMYRAMGDMPKTERIARELLEQIRPMPAFRSQPVIVDAMMQFGDIIRKRDVVEAKSLYEEALRYGRERPKDNEKNITHIEKRLNELKPTHASPK